VIAVNTVVVLACLLSVALQEDSFIAELSDDVDGKEVYCPFELPVDEYGDLMFERRLAMEGSPSPVPSGQAESRRGSTVADTDGSFAYFFMPLPSSRILTNILRSMQNPDHHRLPHEAENQVAVAAQRDEGQGLHVFK
jgi:hypothetical protein